MAPLSASESCDALRRLSEELARRKTRALVYIFRGTVMALGCDSRRLTHDVDALIRERHA